MSGTPNTELIDRGGHGTVHGRFARIATATPAAIAVIFGEERLTYAELDTRANGMAHLLRTMNVGRGELVGVLLDRSVHLIVGLLAILKTGAAYLALDPRDPPARLAVLLADAGVTVVLTDQRHAALAGSCVRTLLVPDCLAAADDGTSVPPGSVGGADALAYVAYTSGSTGQPKGVCIPHRGICRLVVGQRVVPISSDDIFLQYAPVAFDASTWEIWGPLLNGGTLVIAPPTELGACEIVEIVLRTGVTVLWLTAGLFHHIVDAGLPALPAIRYLIAGGDVLSVSHVNRAGTALPNGIVVNGYGPTENTTFTCCYPVHAPVNGNNVPIGLPVTGTEVYVLDERLSPVTDGEVGTLYAAGDGLAHGYMNSPGLTAERFLPNPFAGAPGTRMYDTGDLARRLGNGVLEFLGRKDSQIKVRGFRAEPAEAEYALRNCAGIRDAVVVAQDNGAAGRRLAAFYQSDFPIPSSALRKGLTALPAYLRPATFTWLEEFPLTASGKVDRITLAKRKSRQRPSLGSPFREPGTPIESWLARLWQELLEIDRIGIDDDFFELGGHSLLAVQVNNEIASEFNVVVRARTFYENPTIAELAAQVASLPDAPGKNS